MLCRYLIIPLSACLAACAAEHRRTSSDYQALSQLPTPDAWTAGSVWSFATTDQNGNVQSLAFRVTDEAADTCTSGSWYKLEQISGHVGSFDGVPSEPAFSIEGRFLWISLNSNGCDADDDIRGELREEVFIGERSLSGPFGSSLVGQVKGRRVR
jgi:hypothetical protein